MYVAYYFKKGEKMPTVQVEIEILQLSVPFAVSTGTHIGPRINVRF